MKGDFAGNFLPDCWRNEGRVVPSATVPLGIVSFHLTPQVRRRKIPATFSAASWSRGLLRKKSRVIPEGEKRAVFAGMDCAVHQSGMRGARPLAARGRRRGRTLQQLQRSAPQCSASAWPTPADASPFAGQLPPAEPFTGTAAVVAASESQGRSSRSLRDEQSPQFRFNQNSKSVF